MYGVCARLCNIKCKYLPKLNRTYSMTSKMMGIRLLMVNKRKKKGNYNKRENDCKTDKTNNSN